MKPGCLLSEPLHGQSCGRLLIASWGCWHFARQVGAISAREASSFEAVSSLCSDKDHGDIQLTFQWPATKISKHVERLLHRKSVTDPANQLFQLLDMMHFLFKQETNGAALNGTDWAWFYCSCVKDEPKLVWLGSTERERSISFVVYISVRANTAIPYLLRYHIEYVIFLHVICYFVWNLYHNL